MSADRTLSVAVRGAAGLKELWHAGGPDQPPILAGPGLWAVGGGTLYQLDPRTGRVRFTAPTSETPTALAISPDGRMLAIGHEDGTIQVKPIENLAGAAPRLQAEVDKNRLWDDLASSDAEKAFNTMRVLRTQPSQALLLLQRLPERRLRRLLPEQPRERRRPPASRSLPRTRAEPSARASPR